MQVVTWRRIFLLFVFNVLSLMDVTSSYAESLHATIILELTDLKSSADGIYRNPKYKSDYNQLAKECNGYIDYLIQLVWSDNVSESDEKIVIQRLNQLNREIMIVNNKIKSDQENNDYPSKRWEGRVVSSMPAIITVGFIKLLSDLGPAIIEYMKELHLDSRKNDRKGKVLFVASLERQKWKLND